MKRGFSTRDRGLDARIVIVATTALRYRTPSGLGETMIAAEGVVYYAWMVVWWVGIPIWVAGSFARAIASSPPTEDRPCGACRCA